MEPLPPPGNCIFKCGSKRPLDEEHIIGQQIAEAMDLAYPIPMSWGHMQGGTLARTETGAREDEKLEVTLPRRVCKGCNGGWMRKLDESMIEFMRPALKHHAAVSLTENKQRVLARWATKVALLLSVWMHDEPQFLVTHPRMWVPPDNFPLLHKHHGCPRHTRVWMAAMADIPVSELFATGRRLALAGDPTGYWVMFKLKRLVFYVTGVEVGYDGPVPERNPGDFAASGALVPIWPTSHTARWPPSAQLTPEAAGGVVQAAEHWR